MGKKFLPDFNKIVICRSQAMKSVYKMIEKIAQTSHPVLITGPTGSGKEVIAALIHYSGNNPDAPFIDVNCGSIPESLMESELFGHEKGAFTGALGKHRGYFHLVEKGILFLDEIGELPLLQQAKLLRVLETRFFRPIGAEKRLEFKGKIIAATNKNLELQIKEKKFREDLYYRLNVFKLEVPGLNDRPEDIPDLINFFAEKQRKNFKFGDDAIKLMLSHDWPGNVRQLKNFIDRIAVLSDETIVTAKSVNYFLAEQLKTPYDKLSSITEKILKLDFENKISAVEYGVIQQALENHKGNKSAAAKAIGVHRKVIERRLKNFDSDVNEIHILCASGKKKMSESDYSQALMIYDNALKCVDKYSCSMKFDELKLEILLKQCVCLRNLYGWNNSSAHENYNKALQLGKRLYKIEKLPTVYFGIWAKHLMNLDLQEALDLAKRYFNQGSLLESPYLVSQAYIALANTRFWLGEFEAARENLAGFIKVYENNNEMLIDYGYDPFVFYLMFSSLISFQTGDFKTSKKTIEQLGRYAQVINHPFSTAIALQAGAWISFLFGNYEESYNYAKQLTDNFKDKHFLFYAGIGMIFKGYYNALKGDIKGGIALIKKGFIKSNKEGGLLFNSMYSLILGKVYIMGNKIDESFDLIEKAIHIAGIKNELCYLSDLFCARGRLHKLLKNNKTAENDFREAIRISVKLKSIPSELDAGINLSDLLSETGRAEEAEDILSKILSKTDQNDDSSKGVKIAWEKLFIIRGNNIKIKEELLT